MVYIMWSIVHNLGLYVHVCARFGVCTCVHNVCSCIIDGGSSNPHHNGGARIYDIAITL